MSKITLYFIASFLTLIAFIAGIGLSYKTIKKISGDNRALELVFLLLLLGFLAGPIIFSVMRK